MAENKFERTPAAEKILHDKITKNITKLEKSNYKKKQLSGPEMQKRIKKIIEEEVARS